MGEVQEKELLIMFDVALIDLKKANDLLKAEPNQKEAANRFIKLSQRFFDIYKLFTDTFYVSLNIVAAKSMLLFSRVCLFVSQTLMSTNWVKIRKNPSTARMAITLPKRAFHKVYKRTVKSAFYMYNHDDEEYRKIGFARLDANKVKGRDYNQELVTVAAGLKEVGHRLMILFNASLLIPPSEKKRMPKKKPLEPNELSFETSLEDLKLSKEIVASYYHAIVNQNENDENADEEPSAVIYNCLKPLMDRFGIRERKLISSQVDEVTRGKTAFSEMTDSATELREVSKLLFIIDEGDQ